MRNLLRQRRSGARAFAPRRRGFCQAPTGCRNTHGTEAGLLEEPRPWYDLLKAKLVEAAELVAEWNLEALGPVASGR